MECMKHQSKLENAIYTILWGVLFAAPPISMYLRLQAGDMDEFRWMNIFNVWMEFMSFLLIFLIHNFILAPLLVYRHQVKLYSGSIILIVFLFTIYQCTMPREVLGEKPGSMGGPPPRPEMFDDRPPMEMGPDNQEAPYFQKSNQRPELPPDRPIIFDLNTIFSIIMLIMMLGMNIGVKYYMKSREDARKLVEMEKERLVQQLEYLKYQLNPHFLMNTLNNIHALIDIDTEKAQEAVIQLSKILRYVLYDSNHERVPLSKEMEFMENYVKLMCMRYTDMLDFQVDVNMQISQFKVPPLLVISFVENAFKHGVSYQKPSFIHIAAKHYQNKFGQDRMLWTCTNSKHQKQDSTPIPKEGGVGMENVRRRLDLMYGSNYSLGFNETEESYEVILDIQLEA